MPALLCQRDGRARSLAPRATSVELHHALFALGVTTYRNCTGLARGQSSCPQSPRGLEPLQKASEAYRFLRPELAVHCTFPLGFHDCYFSAPSNLNLNGDTTMRDSMYTGLTALPDGSFSSTQVPSADAGENRASGSA